MEAADCLRKPTKSSFFKVLIGDYATKLLIPALFVHRFRSVIPERVTLRASPNKSWRVDIEEEDDKGLYFKRGWKKFLEDNGLEVGDFVVFKFDGNSTFRVKMFGKSACEKEVLNQTGTDQNYSDDVADHDAGIQNQKQRKMPIPQENQKERNPIAEDYRQMWKRNDEIKQERTDSDERRASEKEAEEESDEIIAIAPDDLMRETGMHERPMQKAFSDSSKLNSKNPSFRVLLKEAYTEKGILCIPTDFFKQHMRCKRQNVEIETSKGSWTVKLVASAFGNGTYGRFSAGWTDCVRDNHFKTGETLTFRMVTTNNCPKFIVHRHRK